MVVASFYLPVILTKTKRGTSRAAPVSSASEDSSAAAAAASRADCASGDGSDGDTEGSPVWTAKWDYEQLIALQVRIQREQSNFLPCVTCP